MYIGLNKDNNVKIGIGKKCLISERHAKSLQKAIGIIKDSKAPVEKIVIYGSCATEKATYESDVDIAVILNDDNLDVFREKLIKLRSAALAITDPEIDMHYISAKKYEEENDAYIKAVKRDGVIVWKI